MPKAILIIEDNNDAEGVDIKLDLFLEGGFQVESDAHQAANLLIKYLQDHGDVVSRGEVKELTGAEAQAVIDAASGQQAVGDAHPESVAIHKQPVLQLVSP